ncbi:hypothetical protein DM01DRAFT_1340993 [Hesseltinella vesiculosa]|uniref:PIN domain-containing protein n=1 Tax=Hesseltinella vesiculosa TaxID=101127 RepID=A0A1X2G2G0_9FUNG|nr:hypothetical protein DM01DRAFT_1340993 [Hesseltinella vesiculosa]
MTSMDIDGPEFILEVNEAIAAVRLKRTGDRHDAQVLSGHNLPPNAFQQLAVIDTNFIITGLKYVDELVTAAERNPGVFLIVIPWIVVKELDKLKMQRKTNTTVEGKAEALGDLARAAMRFLQTKLESKSIALRGQRLDEVYQHDREILGADDRILDCCMYFRYRLEKPVLLLSNDRNLCIKSMIHHIDSLSLERKAKMKELLGLMSGDSTGMQIDGGYFSALTDKEHTHDLSFVNDEDVDMLGPEDIVDDADDENKNTGTKASKHAAQPKGLTTKSEIIASRSHWRNEYYRRGMDLK